MSAPFPPTLEAEARGLGLAPRRFFAQPEAGLGFGSVRRRLARGHHAPHEAVLFGILDDVPVLARLVDRTPPQSARETPIPRWFLSVAAEVAPPVLAGATLAPFGSARFPTGAPLGLERDPARIDLPDAALARTFHAVASNPARLLFFVSDPGVAAELVGGAHGLGDLAITDGSVEVNVPLPGPVQLASLVQPLLRVARVVSARSAAMPDDPAIARWKEEWWALASRHALSFDPGRVTVSGSALGHEVEVALEPAYRHIMTTVTLRFGEPLPFRILVMPRVPLSEPWASRVFGKPDPTRFTVGAFDLTAEQHDAARELLSARDATARLAALDALGARVVLDEDTLTAEVRRPLGGEDAHVLLEGVLAAALALAPAVRNAPYRS